MSKDSAINGYRDPAQLENWALLCVFAAWLNYTVGVSVKNLAGRGSPVVKKVLGIFFKGILITDFHGAYKRICAMARPRCLYHLFTELIKIDQRNNSLAWHMFRKRLSQLLKNAIRLAAKRQSLTANDFNRVKERLYAHLDNLGAEVEIADSNVQRIRVTTSWKLRSKLYRIMIRHESLSKKQPSFMRAKV
ncbi:MAG: transposase [Deltaproteobacteria bacterium]|nr:transposase [Deltaproteobacteria bacterium]